MRSAFVRCLEEIDGLSSSEDIVNSLALLIIPMICVLL